ncbi:Lipid-A-disaccharide synthase [Candidatus Desulfarcum epimagneticum]|uniref:Lipid-A-disaccharide synthase n=1 Tax=uncultured Desulfobacteraceae bacterium TaxID=218296 RepID=A0A484HFE8_9BACT|nr:Lipid-A-disaccharide synthase [uncultured Desulfobacteraceae bacterium]
MKSAGTVMVIAGESSGDHHAARLVRAMDQKRDGLFFCGIGGPALEKEGVRLVFDAALMSVVGVTEVFGALSHILKGFAAARRLLKSLRPDLLILVDFPDFNLRVAATAKKLGVPVLYYISPQVWAWRRGRIKKIARRVDHMAVIFPFEAVLYEERGVPVTFVGHPFLDEPGAPAPRPLPDRPENGRRILGLLPGSRGKEIERHLPVMMGAARLLEEKFRKDGRPAPEFVISLAPGVKRDFMDAVVARGPASGRFHIDESGAGSVLEKSDFVIAVSGTVTLETALSRTPHVIIYKISPVSHWVAKALVRVEHIGIANHIAASPVVPELIQTDATPEKIAAVAHGALTDPDRLRKAAEALGGIRDAMGGPGASERAAKIALEMMK